MCAQDCGRKNGSLNSVGGEDRECHGERALAETGDVLNGNEFLHGGLLLLLKLLCDVFVVSYFKYIEICT